MPDSRRIAVTRQGEVTVARLLDAKIHDEVTVGELARELSDLVEAQNLKHLVLNFGGVEFVSSATLGKLIVLDRKCKSAGGWLRMCRVSPAIQEVFRVTKLDRLFDVRDAESEAVAT